MIERADNSVSVTNTEYPRNNHCRQKSILMFVAMVSRGSSICNALHPHKIICPNNINILFGSQQRTVGACFVNQSSSRSTRLHVPTTLLMSAHTNLQSSTNEKSTPKPTKKKAGTGLLRQLPPLSPHTELLSRASRQTYNNIKDDPKILNVKRRTQKRGAQTLDHLQQSLCKPLRETVDSYKRLYKKMHPFERVVMDLTVTSLQKKDGTTLSSLLEEVHTCRKEIMELSKDWISKVKSAGSAKEAYEFTEEGKDSIGKVFDVLLGECWGGMVDIQRALRQVPMVRLDCPAVVLVGAPNVGELLAGYSKLLAFLTLSDHLNFVKFSFQRQIIDSTCHL